ncbi:MAG: hypothetical protein LBJ96_06400 [Holosporaceae bacterium]|jgi:hypothetical protein|nr:hypothetical protein [Holosporaceae bacterium]
MTLKKTVLCSLLGIFLMTETSEARVTQEVAEATVSYLMRAAGIPITQRTVMHREAIIDMLYTDDGQRQMVNWAKDGIFPPRLGAGGLFRSANTYNDQNFRDNGLQLLFPCATTGTFSSFAAHQSRLGFHALSNQLAVVNGLLAALKKPTGNKPKSAKNFKKIDQIYANICGENSIDTQLAFVLFILDICDTADQVLNILDAVRLVGYNKDAVTTAITGNHNEYDHRPVSATSVGGHGDCVQTLYRHLINIAVQNDLTNPNNYNVSHLPDALQDYYAEVYGQRGDVINVDTKMITEAGKMDLGDHDRWSNKLASVVVAKAGIAVPEAIVAISRGKMANIAEELPRMYQINPGTQQPQLSVFSVRATDAYRDSALVPAIGNTVTTGETARIENALNALDGRCEGGEKRFIVHINNNAGDIAQLAQSIQLPKIKTSSGIISTDTVIQIADRLWNRTITIGVAGDHAEIASIQQY